MIKQLLAAGLVSGLVLSTAAGQPSKLPEIPTVKAWRGKTSERETYFNPVLKDNSIQYGNKVLSLSPDGKIEFSSKGSVFKHHHIGIRVSTDELKRGAQFSP